MSCPWNAKDSLHPRDEDAADEDADEEQAVYMLLHRDMGIITCLTHCHDP